MKRFDAKAHDRQRYCNDRALVVAHYGGECARCGEDDLLFLEIHHLNGGGNKDGSRR